MTLQTCMHTMSYVLTESIKLKVVVVTLISLL